MHLAFFFRLYTDSFPSPWRKLRKHGQGASRYEGDRRQDRLRDMSGEQTKDLLAHGGHKQVTLSAFRAFLHPFDTEKERSLRSVSPPNVGLSKERSDRLELSDLIRSRTAPPTLNFAQVDESQKKRQPLVSRFDLIDRTL